MPKVRKFIDWDEQPLGEMTDAAIAKKTGVTRENVRQQRAKRGIPSCWDKSECTIIEMVGRQYGYLRVIERSPEKSANGAARWVCACKCGEEIVVEGTRLRNGSTRSCGCMTREYHESLVKDLTGKKFGKWTVLERWPTKDKNRNMKWLCECDCGKRSVVYGNSLKTGRSQSCGCSRHESLER